MGDLHKKIIECLLHAGVLEQTSIAQITSTCRIAKAVVLAMRQIVLDHSAFAEVLDNSAFANVPSLLQRLRRCLERSLSEHAMVHEAERLLAMVCHDRETWDLPEPVPNGAHPGLFVPADLNVAGPGCRRIAGSFLLRGHDYFIPDQKLCKRKDQS